MLARIRPRCAACCRRGSSRWPYPESADRPAPMLSRSGAGGAIAGVVARGERLDRLLTGLVLPPGWIIDVDPVSLL